MAGWPGRRSGMDPSDGHGAEAWPDAGTPQRNGPSDGHGAEAWPDGRDAGAEWTRLMEKLLFLFHRKDGLSRDEFLDHYLARPRPARTAGHPDDGRLHREPGRHRGAGAPDAITEVWTASVAGLLRSVAVVRDPRRRQGADDRPRLVHRPVRHVRGRGAGGAPGSDRPDAKRVSCYVEGESVPEAGPDVTGVVEHRVVQVPGDDVAAYTTIVSTWAPTADALGPRSGVKLTTSASTAEDPAELTPSVKSPIRRTRSSAPARGRRRASLPSRSRS